MKYTNFIIIILTIGLASCDPIHSITLTNTTNDTIKVSIEKNANIDLDSEKYLIKDTSDKRFDTFKIPPREVLSLGKAIAELDNDIKFDTLYIYKKDSITHVSGKDNIIKLFDRGFWGLKRPYNITVR